MTRQEFSDQFDVFYNNITSNQAPGLDEYEKSVFLTKALDELLKAYFTTAGNKLVAGIDDTARRLIDFSMLINTISYVPIYSNLLASATKVDYFLLEVKMGDAKFLSAYKGKTVICNLAIVGTNKTEGAWQIVITTLGAASEPVNVTPGTIVEVSSLKNVYMKATTEGWESLSLGDQITGYKLSLDNTITVQVGSDNQDVFDFRSNSVNFSMPADVMMILNEQLKVYRLSSKYSGSPSKIAYLQVTPISYTEYNRLMSKPFKRPLHYLAWRLFNLDSKTSNSSYVANIIVGPNDVIDTYAIRYVRRPKPIILEDLLGLTIEGEPNASDCELDPILHLEILQRAVELAKVAWLSSSETEAGPALAQGYAVGASGTELNMIAGSK